MKLERQLILILPLGAAAMLACLLAPLDLTGQFIPDKPVVIHPAVESQPVRKGPIEGPGTGLGATSPSPPAARGAGAGRAGGRSGRGGGEVAPIPPAPVAPEIGGAGAAIEQTARVHVRRSNPARVSTD